MILRQAGIGWQATKTWKASTDPEFAAKMARILDLYDHPAMIVRAQRRLRRYGDRVRLAQGSATDLHSASGDFGGGQDASYDAVFDFAIIHHIPNWRDALAEVARVLKPGGRFFLDEVTATALARPSYRLLFDHPTEGRFTAGEFLAELPRHGLDVGDRWRTRIGGTTCSASPPGSRDASVMFAVIVLVLFAAFGVVDGGVRIWIQRRPALATRRAAGGAAQPDTLGRSD